MKRKLLISWFVMWVFSTPSLFPQSSDDIEWESVLETLLSTDEELSSYAREELLIMYESLHSEPLNINTATRDELRELLFLSDEQIEDIHAYIYLHGPMKTLGELQLTGSLDYDTRRMLRLFVYAGDPPQEKERIIVKDILGNGRSELIGRMDIPLYLRDGFRPHSAEELKRYPNRAYMGTPLSHSIRYTFNWHNRVRFGISADKDAGEPFGSPNRAGYDFCSPYLFIRDMGVIRELALGNFKAQLGYGLLMGAGFGQGKSTMLSERRTQGLKPHSSTQEYGYLRGAGIAVGGGHTTLTLLGAVTPLDGTLKGDSSDISLGRPRYALSAEFSVSDGKPALICNQTFRLPRGWKVNSLFRAYSPDYFALHSNALAEGSVANEIGLLTGFTYSRGVLKVNGYADLFMFPQARYGASGKSNGMDLRLEADRRLGRRDALYLSARFKSKQKDCKYTGQLEYCRTGRYRLRWTHTGRGGSEFKTQILYTRYDFIAEPISNGWAITQSYSGNLIKERLDLNLSAVLFMTDSYDSNVSVYESGLRYSYGFMTLSGEGVRLAMTLKWNVVKGLQLNFKAGGTWYMDRDEISQAQQRIDASHKEDLSVQLIRKF